MADVTVDLLSAWRAAEAPSKAIESAAQAQTKVYIWVADVDMLEAGLWSFEDFMRDKAHRWIGKAASDTEYAEVDRRREMNGKIIHRKQGSNGVAMFGHAMLQHFALEPSFTNLNHGGVGAAPRVVLEARRRWQGKADYLVARLRADLCWGQTALSLRRTDSFAKSTTRLSSLFENAARSS